MLTSTDEDELDDIAVATNDKVIWSPMQKERPPPTLDSRSSRRTMLLQSAKSFSCRLGLVSDVARHNQSNNNSGSTNSSETNNNNNGEERHTTIPSLARSWTKRFLFEREDLAHKNEAKQAAAEESQPDSDVERIVQRLEKRSANRVHVPIEVKNRFLKLCDEASLKRMAKLLRSSNNPLQRMGNDTTDMVEAMGGCRHKTISNTNSCIEEQEKVIKTAPCILRSDVIQIRKAIRLEVDSRSRLQHITDGLKDYFGFRTNCKVLLRVLNRAVDLIDESAPKSARMRRESITNHLARPSIYLPSNFLETSSMAENNLDQGDTPENIIDDNEWFYYKDFAFYSLKVESNYPWMRNAGAFSALLTVAFYLFTPILWCTILKDPNICPRYGYNNVTGEEVDIPNSHGWLSALFFASGTMSTVGYGDITVLVNTENDSIDTPEPENWRIFIAIIFMILSLIVSVVGFQAGIDSHFHPFRRRIDIFGRRVFEVLRDANIVKGKDDKHEEIISRMRLTKLSQLAEILLVFLIHTLVGVFAVQLSLLTEKEDEYGDKLSLSWMESFYWSVQTTTTIGYGDVTTPESLRWFLFLYLAISTYFVGSAFGKLAQLSKKIESMQLLYTWQQQEASYTMLHDYSGRPDKSTNSEATKDVIEPEIDQFEFTVASLVVMGKITSEDVIPILEKFKQLTGAKSKITSADVSGPLRKKRDVVPCQDEEGAKEKVHTIENQNSRKSSNPGALKQIAQAFKEEVLTANNQDKVVAFEEEEKEILTDYSNFFIPQNTHAIAIDDSKIQRKLLFKIFENAGIPPDRCTICGDGYSEIMGFEDYVVTFMEKSDGYVFMIVDENLDFVDETTNKHDTISGSQCVENIRRRLAPETERRMFAIIRSANDSSSDIDIYESRAHAFIPKAPIKRAKVKETLAPMWLKRFPPSEFGEESTDILSQNESENQTTKLSTDIAIGCTPYDVAHLIDDIDSLFKKDVHINESRIIQNKMHELKGDLLTMNSNIPVHSLIGQVNLILTTQAPATLLGRWSTLRDNTNELIQSLQKNFRLPNNTFAIGIDDSKIQRKLLVKLFDFLSIPEEQCYIMGDSSAEIMGFEDFVVDFMNNHKEDYVLLVVDEHLDTVDTMSNEPIEVSGSECVNRIRKRLSQEVERRMLAIVRSADDSITDIVIYRKKAHEFLPKSPIRREKVNETIAPIWMRRFPASDFVDSAIFDMTDETVSTSQFDELACTPFDIAQNLVDIEGLFKKDVHITDIRLVHDRFHELKGDLLTLTSSDASMISILGMINLILLGHKQSPGAIFDKWCTLKDRIYDVINSMETNNSEAPATTPIQKKKSLLLRMKTS